jgi:hypothetical protein
MSTGLDDDVQIVEKPWEEAVLEQEEYKTALAILDCRKYGSPGRVLETAFLDRLGKTKSSSSQALADRALLDLGWTPLRSRG